jgi:ATP-dependent protease Clp ATPase subunit
VLDAVLRLLRRARPCPSCGTTLVPPYRCGPYEEAARVKEAERQREEKEAERQREEIEAVGEKIREFEQGELAEGIRKAELGRGFARIIGQQNIVDRLRAFAELYRKRGLTSGHVLLVGPDGHGKRLIAHALAEEHHVNIRATEETAVERPGDLAAILRQGTSCLFAM